MFFKIFLFLTFLSVHLSATEESENCSIAPIPAWVKLYDSPLDPVSIDSSQIHLQCLHSDTQKYWEEKTSYHRHVYKALTQSGVESVSQIRIDFTPAFEKVVVHKIRIFRGGVELDRLQDSRHKVIQRESGLEDNLFYGSLSLVYFLNDVREGDIVEYAFSVIGENPVFDSHYTGYVNLQQSVSVEKISYRLLAHPSRFLLIKPVNTDIEPEVTDLSEELREWTWEAEKTLPDLYESDEPYWYDPHAFVQISEYPSWREIALKLIPFYTLPENFNELAPIAMRELVQKWEETSSSPEACALQALRFVQDEIRYLGIEEGIGAFAPSDPVTVFERRFGDCKDKSFLLHGLLKLMNISSTPILVHTTHGKFLKERLPSPFAFNHAVLQIQIGDVTYFVDPTRGLQGGSLETNFFPDYKLALPIKKEATDLIFLPQTVLKTPTEIHSSFVQTSENGLSLNISIKFYDSRADIMRHVINQKGMSQLEKEELAEIQKTYKKVKVNAPLEVSDDRENNTLSLTGSYAITTQKGVTAKKFPFISFIMQNYLDGDFDSERVAPYALSYPLWVKEYIHLENQKGGFPVLNESFILEHESLFYAQEANISGNVADFQLELRHLQDHVQVEAFESYLEIMEDIEEREPCERLAPSN